MSARRTVGTREALGKVALSLPSHSLLCFPHVHLSVAPSCVMCCTVKCTPALGLVAPLPELGQGARGGGG